MTITPEKQTALDWIESNRRNLSDWHREIWDMHEPAWREYRSAAWYVAMLRQEGFEVEEGSGGMPTAFCATWGDQGPVIGGYAEYDAVPGNSQDPVPYRKPRDGVHRWAAGHTDPHSALGMGALGGLLAAKAAIEEHGIEGRLKFLGEPAEKVCGSKPVHAAKGYFDDMDAAISYHPWGSNTVVWDTHCGSYWSKVYSFECDESHTWGSMAAVGRGDAHTVARAPGANDALCLMYTTTKYTKEAMLPHTGTWTLNERQVGKGSGATGADVEDTADRRVVIEPQHNIHAIADPNKIAFLSAIRIVRIVRSEQPRLTGFADLPVELHDEAFLPALVILVGSIDVEEFETGPLRRRDTGRGERDRVEVEQMLRPAI